MGQENKNQQQLDKKERIPEPQNRPATSEPARVGAFVHFIWAAAVVAIFAILAIWVLPLLLAEKVGRDTAGAGREILVRGFEAIAEACKTTVVAHNIYSQTLGQLDQTRKLVVHTQDVDIDFNLERPERKFREMIPWGKATVRLKVMGNRVQFYVPLDELSEKNFVYDRRNHRLTIEVPKLKIDRDLVKVQSDPAKIFEEKNGSWMPFGPDVEQLSLEARSQLENKVILAANNTLVWGEARRAAQKTLEHFFSLMRNSLADNVELQIYLP
ncbi:MAG: DUF4230 domain-containing protein [Erysipelotrichia bacterium]|nr:DUF4230 domain-containing protein [Erysipelotrichia bacterium]